MFRRFILKTNDWYEELSDIKGGLFFLVVIIGGIILTQYIMAEYKLVWPFAIYTLIFVLWRFMYLIYNTQRKINK